MANSDFFFCKDCADKIKNAFDFKRLWLNTEENLRSYSKLDEMNNIDVKPVVTTTTDTDDSFCENGITCRLCKYVIDGNALPLSKLFINSIQESFNYHIPEMVRRVLF